MDTQGTSEPGDQQQKRPAIKTWAPIAISSLALVLSGFGYMAQERALSQQREQISAQNDQLETQRKALEAQQNEFQAAEERWKGDGPLLIARGYLRQDPRWAIELLSFSDEQPGRQLPYVHMDQQEAQRGPTFIEAELTNIGRSPGLIKSVVGKMRGYDINTPVAGIWPCEVFAGTNNGMPLPPPVCSADFAEEDVICLSADGTETVCRFPLQVPEQTSIRLRFKLHDYFTQSLACREDLGQGRVDVTIQLSSGSSLGSAFFASNSRGCPKVPPGVTLSTPAPFK